MKRFRNQRTTENLIVLCLTVFVVMLLVNPVSVLADETSGRIIKEIVKEVDKEMTRLEERVTDFSEKSEDLQNRLEEESNTFKKTNDEMERHKILANMLVISAQLNEQDLQEISAYKETLTALVPKLGQLRVEIRKIGNMGFKKQEGFLKFRGQMVNMMTNSVRIMKMLRQVTVDEQLNRELIPIENTLVGLYKMYASSLRPGPASYAQVEESIKIMEYTTAQLNIVEKLLQQERMRLKVDNLNQISRLALMRLFKGRLNMGHLTEIPLQKMDEVEHRSELYFQASKAVNGGGMGSGGSVSRSPDNQAILNRISTGGNLFDQ
ncbi:hypothetical protein LCGC14_1979640 [marine sediment metagenome]|uniref:Uncharacterized protein n=1 Tax=marine sediment metagenome TaxID=412755 RepID=A0A0F9FXI7_9ZZZZ